MKSNHLITDYIILIICIFPRAEYRENCENVLYVHENNEPLEFTNSFPTWIEHKDKKSLFHSAPVSHSTMSYLHITYAIKTTCETFSCASGLKVHLDQDRWALVDHNSLEVNP